MSFYFSVRPEKKQSVPPTDIVVDIKPTLLINDIFEQKMKLWLREKSGRKKQKESVFYCGPDVHI